MCPTRVSFSHIPMFLVICLISKTLHFKGCQLLYRAQMKVRSWWQTLRTSFRMEKALNLFVWELSTKCPVWLQRVCSFAFKWLLTALWSSMISIPMGGLSGEIKNLLHLTTCNLPAINLPANEYPSQNLHPREEYLPHHSIPSVWCFMFYKIILSSLSIINYLSNNKHL